MVTKVKKNLEVLLQTALIGADKPELVIPAINIAWVFGAISAEEKFILNTKVEAIKGIDDEIRRLVSRWEGNGDPILERDLRKQARKWLDDTKKLFSTWETRILKARIKHDFGVEL